MFNNSNACPFPAQVPHGMELHKELQTNGVVLCWCWILSLFCNLVAALLYLYPHVPSHVLALYISDSAVYVGMAVVFRML